MKALWLIALSSAALLAAPTMKCDALAAKPFGRSPGAEGRKPAESVAFYLRPRDA